jgi:hypothetical protein
MSNRQEYIEAVGQFVQGEIPLSEADKILAISQAVKEHSKHKPLIVVEDIDGDGGFDYAVSGLESWNDGFSVIKQVEYPVDDDDQSPDILADDEWTIYQKPAGDYLRFLEDTPDATEDMRITYTAPHTCTDAACSIKNIDTEAVQALAAAYFCNMLSAYYAQAGEPTIQADSVDHKSRSSEYAGKARMYRKMYLDHLGVKEGQTIAASVTMDQDLNGSWGSDKLTHKGKYR